MDRYGVIGNPANHNQSLFVTQLFAEQTKQQLNYQPIPTPLGDLENAVTLFRDEQGKGIHIGMPFKHRAFSLVDDASDSAKQAEAVSSIAFNEDGSSYGDNTDGIGLVRDLIQNQGVILKGKQVLVLGAGCIVRSVLAELLLAEPATLIIANQTEHKAFELAEDFSQLGPIEACELFALESESFDLVINGVNASLPGDMLELPQQILRKGAFCYDMTQSKNPTAFMQWAKEQGAAQCSDGLGMLVEQAAETFHRWRGVTPNTQAVLARLREGKEAAVPA